MQKDIVFSRSVLCLSLAAAFPAFAEDDVERLIRPESSVTLGVGSVGTDSQRFGVYNGMAKEGEHLIGAASIVRRADDTGTWLRFDARDIGLPTRELRFEHEKQGDWAYSLEYNQTPRFTPYDVHTGISGIGTTAQAVPNAGGVRSTAAETEFKTERFKTGFGLYKALSPYWEFTAKLQSEEKKGSRLFGRGTGTTQEFLAEPIDSTTRQLDLILNYTGDKLQFSGGYYGSFYNNRKSSLVVTGGAAALSTFTPIALPPDNLAHQLNLSAAYDFTATTRGTVKYAYTRNTQTDAFILPVANSVPVGTTYTNDSGRSHLGGRVDTTLFQLGLTSRPTKKLSLLANLRHEDRDDKTAVAQYVPSGGSTDGYNEPRSLTATSGKLEATYRLPDGYSVTGGIDYEKKKRGVSGVRIVGYRVTTEEVAYRGEIKRALFDTLTGTASYTIANRNGSDYATLVNAAGALYVSGGLLQPIYIADRDRNKFKMLLDWSPADALSMQFAVDDSRDVYGRRGGTYDIGARSGDARLYSVDASYALNDEWQLTGYASVFNTRIDQAAGNTAGTYWTAAMKNLGTNYGAGVKGKLSGKLDVGVDLLWAEDISEYRFGGNAASLPDINNIQTTLKLFASYAWDKDTDVRLDYVHDRRKTNDWTWNGTSTPYVYTDGTWLYQNPNETVNFVGVSVKYSFR